MFVKKNFSFKNLMQFSGHHLTWLTPLMTTVAYLQFYTELEWLRMPWQPISIVGTAVAFYLGFKNNQSYDRLWEARKVWGAIVNSSRAWGAYTTGFVSDYFSSSSKGEESMRAIHKTLIYRHIAWLYALRSQLLLPTQWEHVSQKGLVGVWAERNRKRFGVGLLEDEITIEELRRFLPETELKRLIDNKNTATQIIQQQSQDLKSLREQQLIDDFRHMELEKILYDFYVHQGKLERIKKFPLPRQYGAMSFIFVAIFVAILPFGITPLFLTYGLAGFFTSIFISILVAWVFIIMELVGDYSENPFEGTGNDIPMYSLCRTIEIDLREMLGETKLPEPIKPVNDVLM